MFGFGKKNKKSSVAFSCAYTTLKYQDKEFVFASIPDTCPHCEKLVGMNIVGTVLGEKGFRHQIILVCFQCPVCKELTIGRYTYNYMDEVYRTEYPPFYPQLEYHATEFPQEISSICPKFVDLYNQSAKVEHHQCIDIAGAGYRKAIEFLIRDFAKYINPTKKSEIDRTDATRNVIKNFLNNFPKIKEAADSALTLGNDETHYSKIYSDYDLSDLKSFIDITCSEIAGAIKLNDFKKQKEEIKKKQLVQVKKINQLPEDLKK